MRVAIFVHQFPAVSQTFVLSQITRLIQGGHKVEIYANTPGTDDRVHPDVARYGLLHSTHYWPRARRNRIWRLFFGLGLLAGNVHRHPELLLLSVRALKYGKQFPWSMLVSSLVALLNKDTAYDILHGHFGPNGIKVAILRELGALRGKVVTTFHGYDMTGYLKVQGEHVYEYLFAKGDLFLPISEHWKNRLIELGCDERKIVVHRMSIDCQRFEFSPRQLGAGECIRLVSIARLTEKKGLEYLLRAIAEIPLAHQRIECEIVGDGPLRSHLEELVDELRLGEIVKLVGWKCQDEVVQILARAHIFVAPSVTSKDGDQEGIPVVLMEAMAMGLPVISTVHSGIPELVQDRISGYLVPEREVSALRDALTFIFAHPHLWAELGRAGRQYVENDYDLYSQNRRLVDIYRELLNPPTAVG